MAGTKPCLRRGSVSPLLTRIWPFARCGGRDLDFETSTRLHLPLIPCAQETTTRLQQAREGGRSVSLQRKRENRRRFPCMCYRCSSLLPPLAIHEYICHPSRRLQALRSIPLLLPISLSGWGFFLRFQHRHFRFRKFAFAFLVIYSWFWKPSFGTGFEEHKARS